MLLRRRLGDHPTSGQTDALTKRRPTVHWNMSQTAESSTGLKREMGLRDVTLFAIACIVGTRWIPAAAHAGPGSVMLWLAAALLFALPLAIAVGALAVKYPGCAGGLYVWTRGDFGPWHGFLCFWVYWMGIAFWLPTAALFYMGAGFYALGPRYAHLADNRAALMMKVYLLIKKQAWYLGTADCQL